MGARRGSYPAEAAVYRTSQLMPVWQLGYVLAPAREWGGFGRLDVRVELPRGWEAAATLLLAPIFPIVGTLAAQVAAVRGHRRAVRARPAREPARELASR